MVCSRKNIEQEMKLFLNPCIDGNEAESWVLYQASET